MDTQRLHPTAWTALLLTGLYAAAAALCSIFVSVYFWINSHDFGIVCSHYLALFTVTPFTFVLAGWYSQARERLHVYRLGLVLHAVYYGTLLLLRERAPAYAAELGALQGVTWGIYWAGANTFNFDVTREGKREFYFGLLQAVNGVFRLLGPLIGGFIIAVSPGTLQGFHSLFAISLGLYALSFAVSFKMPPDREPRPFRLRRALLPGRDQRDWRLIMLASFTLAGNQSVFAFLPGLLMYMETGDELSVGAYASLQALVGIVVALVLGRMVVPRNRAKSMRLGAWLLLVAGVVLSIKLSVATLIVFGMLRAVAAPMFGIPHVSLRLDTIAKSAEDPAQRIEYICAWEVPMALGRIAMMLILMGMYAWLRESGLGLRLAVLILCSTRLLTYALLRQTTALRRGAGL
ncbi:MAG: MFS transporter [Candidatus Hydrogenedentes bacterium]|nr:MFS transporter [Candidatus Hydrogenedentota bacterium]